MEEDTFLYGGKLVAFHSVAGACILLLIWRRIHFYMEANLWPFTPLLVHVSSSSYGGGGGFLYGGKLVAFPSVAVSSVRACVDASHMRRRIHACHMRRWKHSVAVSSVRACACVYKESLVLIRNTYY
jgi:hypothetical protein